MKITAFIFTFLLIACGIGSSHAQENNSQQMPMYGPYGPQGQPMHPMMMERMMRMREHRQQMMQQQTPQPKHTEQSPLADANTSAAESGKFHTCRHKGDKGHHQAKMQMRMQRMEAMENHMQKMESHLKNIEALLRQLVEQNS